MSNNSMGLYDWFERTQDRYREQGLRDASVDSVHEFYIGGLRRLESIQNPQYDPHWDRDWDILCILDACRVDLFRNACEKHSWLPASNDVETLSSTGSTSREWMQTMFSEKYHGEMAKTAYVTGNLFAEHIDTTPFSHIEIYQPRTLDEYDIYTVPPSELTDAAIRYWREANADRLIIHYMQPHTPFRSRPEWFGTDAAKAGELRTSWGQGFAELRDGDIPRNEFVAAYQDNLDWVLNEVNRLRRNADGDLALSADHGNGLGEWGVHGHPEGINVAAVREVPFATIQATDTGESKPKAPIRDPEQEDNISDSANDRLRRLGYKV